VLADYYRALIDTLTKFYETKPAPDSLEAGRRGIAAWSRAELSGGIGARLRTYRVGRLADRPINNAQLVGVLLYRTHLDWFERWFEKTGDIKRAVAEL